MGRTHELQRSLVCGDTSTPVKKDSRTTKSPCKELCMRENEINTLNSAHFCELRLKLQGYIWFQKLTVKSAVKGRAPQFSAVQVHLLQRKETVQCGWLSFQWKGISLSGDRLKYSGGY